MKWILRYSQNPNKHELMPGDYPWVISNLPQIGYEEVTDQELEGLLSIDLSEYSLFIREEENIKQQTAQRLYGLELIPEMIDMMGARNLKLAQDGVSFNMITLANDNASVKLLIETGALKTARTICFGLKLKYTNHADIYNFLIEKISTFLKKEGYE